MPITKVTYTDNVTTIPASNLNEIQDEIIDIRTAYDGTVYPSAGDAVRSQIEEAMESSGSSTGITNAVKQALLACFENVAWSTDNGQDYYDALVASMEVHATNITVRPSTVSFSSASETQQLTTSVTPRDSSDSIVWTTSNSSVATVSNTGLVTPIANGSCTITATAGNVSASCAVTVSGIVRSFDVINSLTYCTNSNTVTRVAEGDSYTATLTADSGYLILNVVVTMGGEDVTNTVYSNGSIDIAEITGEITIYAKAYEMTIIPVTWSQGGLGNTGSHTSYDANRYKNYRTDEYIPIHKNQTLVLYNTNTEWTNKNTYNGTDYINVMAVAYQVTGTTGNADGSYVYLSNTTQGFTTEGSFFAIKYDEADGGNVSKVVSARLTAYNMAAYHETAVVAVVDGV